MIKKNLLVLSLGLMLAMPAHAAKIRVYPVVIDTEATRATINVVNEGTNPLTLEAQGLKGVADVDIGVFPPVVTLQPGVRQVFRVILPPVSTSTQSWRVRISEVQARAFGGGSSAGQMRNELAFEIPVFLNSRGGKPDLVREGGQVRNAGNRQVLISKIGEHNVHVYLMPGQSMEVEQGDRLFSLEQELAVR